jgi:hypothetical protein
MFPHYFDRAPGGWLEKPCRQSESITPGGKPTVDVLVIRIDQTVFLDRGDDDRLDEGLNIAHRWTSGHNRDAIYFSTLVVRNCTSLKA